MLSKPIDNIIKTQFEALYAKGLQKANERFDNLKAQAQLNHFQKCKLFIEEDEKIEMLVNENEYPILPPT
jgi:hypothetical protein